MEVRQRTGRNEYQFFGWFYLIILNWSFILWDFSLPIWQMKMELWYVLMDVKHHHLDRQLSSLSPRSSSSPGHHHYHHHHHHHHQQQQQHHHHHHHQHWELKQQRRRWLRKRHSKVKPRCFKLHPAYSISFNSSNVGNFLWSWILEDCIKVQEEKKKVIVLCSRPRQNVKLGIFTS